MMTDPIKYRNTSWRIAPQNKPTTHSRITSNGTEIIVTGQLRFDNNKNGMNQSPPLTEDSSIKIQPISKTGDPYFTVFLPTTTIHGVTSIKIIANGCTHEYATI